MCIRDSIYIIYISICILSFSQAVFLRIHLLTRCKRCKKFTFENWIWNYCLHKYWKEREGQWCLFLSILFLLFNILSCIVLVNVSNLLGISDEENYVIFPFLKNVAQQPSITVLYKAGTLAGHAKLWTFWWYYYNGNFWVVDDVVANAAEYSSSECTEPSVSE